MPHEINVVLVEPEIPMNTGTIGRLCLATGSTLHLIEPLGFEISNSRLKRAGLDYWKHVNVKTYPGLEMFLRSILPSAQKVFFSTKGKKDFFQHAFQPGAYLFFAVKLRGYQKVYCNPIRIPLIASHNMMNGFGLSILQMQLA